MTKAPALFVGHGSPMNAIEDTPASRGWGAIARRFPKPRAIVVVSAHWVTDGVRVTANARPRTIHDFGKSFPQALFDVEYPAPGDPTLAQEITARLQHRGARLDESWGLDHGAWSVLRHMYPNADIPSVQLSIGAHDEAEDELSVARELATLRDENVLILATGNTVHNIPAFFQTKEIQPWVTSFDTFVTEAVVACDDVALLDYWKRPDARDAAPDYEHFVPVIFAIGARLPGDQIHIFNRYHEPGISMTSFAYGLPQ